MKIILKQHLVFLWNDTTGSVIHFIFHSISRVLKKIGFFLQLRFILKINMISVLVFLHLENATTKPGFF